MYFHLYIYSFLLLIQHLIYFQETLIHSSNCLAIKALKDGNRHLGFVKSCIAFSEVTLPSISPQIRQLNLYLETAEVMFSSGVIMLCINLTIYFSSFLH